METRAAVAGGCAFLAARQLPSGELVVCTSSDFEQGGAWRYDPTAFASAVIALCLLGVTNPEAALVTRRAAEFLRAQVRPPGVWRFWTAEHPQHRVIPFDSDDTACAAAALRRQGDEPDRAVRLLLANRDARGLFYTWFVPHPHAPPRHIAFWRAAASGWPRPFRRAAFWRLTEASPRDVDALVNANVLFLLGESRETQPVIEHLIAVVREGREGSCDRWYGRPLAIHHAIARCFDGGVAGLSPIRELAIGRILAHRRPDGSFGDGPLDTALAASALSDWRHCGCEAATAVSSLIKAQLDSGGWPAEAYYFGGPRRVVRWGSEEITTGFCVQALWSSISEGVAAGSRPTDADRPTLTCRVLSEQPPPQIGGQASRLYGEPDQPATPTQLGA